VIQDGENLGYAGIMNAVAAIRLLHAEAPANRGSTITGALGVDNIRVLGVPEPTTLELVAALAAARFVRCRKAPRDL
jgi:hypothetical protein